MITQITTTLILISTVGTNSFVKSDFIKYEHNGMSCADIGHEMAIKTNSNLEIKLNKQVNEMPNDNTVVYSYKHPTGELSIYTIKCW